MTSSSSGGGSPGSAESLSAIAAPDSDSPWKIRLWFGCAGFGFKTTIKHSVSSGQPCVFCGRMPDDIRKSLKIIPLLARDLLHTRAVRPVPVPKSR